MCSHLLMLLQEGKSVLVNFFFNALRVIQVGFLWSSTLRTKKLSRSLAQRSSRGESRHHPARFRPGVKNPFVTAEPGKATLTRQIESFPRRGRTEKVKKKKKR